MSKVVPFSIGPVTSRCLPFRSIKGNGRHQLNPFQNAELVAWAVTQNLAESTSFYDDDVALAWSPQTADFYKDPNSSFWKHLADVKAKLDAAGVEVFSVSCELAAYDCFTYGALTNKDAAIRELAIKKLDRAIAIGHFFNAAVFTFDADAEGFDSPFTIDWLAALKNLTAGLNHIEDVIKGQKFENYMGACLAPRKAVPFQYGYVNNVGDALSLIHGNLRTPEFWGISPSTYQLEQAGWSAAPATIANLAACGGLASVKIGAGTQKLADRPLPPLFGTANLKETVQTLWILSKIGWQGVVELDSMMAPVEVKVSNDVIARKQFVANTASALTIALELASRIKDEALSELTPPEADLMTAAVFCGVNVDDVINRTVKGGAPAPQPEPVGPAPNHEIPIAPKPQVPEQQPVDITNDNQQEARPAADSHEAKRYDNSKKHSRNNRIHNDNKDFTESRLEKPPVQPPIVAPVAEIVPSEPVVPQDKPEIKNDQNETPQPAAEIVQPVATEVVPTVTAEAAQSVATATEQPEQPVELPPVPTVEQPASTPEPVAEQQPEQPAVEQQPGQPVVETTEPAENMPSQETTPVVDTVPVNAESVPSEEVAAETPQQETTEQPKSAKPGKAKPDRPKRVYRRTTGIRKISKRKPKA